jgi:hypothetical protein
MIAGQIVVIDTGLRDAFEPNANRNDRLIRARREHDFPLYLITAGKPLPWLFQVDLECDHYGWRREILGRFVSGQIPHKLQYNFEGCTVRRYAAEMRDSGTRPNPEAIDKG